MPFRTLTRRIAAFIATGSAAALTAGALAAAGPAATASATALPVNYDFLAGALGVRYLFTTRVKKLGSSLLVTTSLIDTSAQQSKNGQGKGADKPDDYDTAVDAAVAEALGLVKHALKTDSVSKAAPLATERTGRSRIRVR